MIDKGDLARLEAGMKVTVRYADSEPITGTTAKGPNGEISLTTGPIVRFSTGDAPSSLRDLTIHDTADNRLKRMEERAVIAEARAEKAERDLETARKDLAALRVESAARILEANAAVADCQAALALIGRMAREHR